MAEEFLKVNNISKSFAGVKALEDVSFTINSGEIHCLVGENGSGKSTLIKIIAGVYAPDSGEIVINGKPFKSLHPIESIREGIQIIYQDFSLFPNLTVAENIALNTELEKNKKLVNWKEVRSIAREALEKINIKLDLDALVEQMSVADKQLIAISRALLQNAQLIIMDEPTTALTQNEVKSLFKVIKSLQAKGISILFVSHKLNEVQEISDRTLILRNGKKIADAPAVEIDRAKLVYYMTGKEIAETSYEYTPKTDCPDCLLKVEHLTSPGRFYDISFDLRPGEIVGITGLLGSGRTELALSLFGVWPAEQGTITINDKEIKIKSIQDAVKHGIGYVPEDRLTEGLFLPQSIGKNLIIRKMDDLLTKSRLIDNNRVDSEISRWVSNLSIKTPNANLPVQSLSGGNQQRVVLAKWLASNPQILILNGPTVGVDVGSKSDLHEIMRNLAREGMGLLVMSDDIPELLATCNRILLMRKGRIVQQFDRSGVTEKELNLKLVEA
jgi:simple sugar transport system ATP-binding protein